MVRYMEYFSDLHSTQPKSTEKSLSNDARFQSRYELILKDDDAAYNTIVYEKDSGDVQAFNASLSMSLK